MDAGRLRTVRTGLCAFTALLLATTLGAVVRSEASATHAASHGKRVHALVAGPQLLTRAAPHAHDPVSHDLVAAETVTVTNRATVAVNDVGPPMPGGTADRTGHSRDPPGRELV